MYSPVVLVVVAVAVALMAHSVTPTIPPYSLNKIENNLPGIYFEYVSTLNTQIDHWTTTIRINLEKIQPSRIYGDQITAIQKECPGSPLDCAVNLARCNRLFRRFNHVDKLYQTIEILLPQTKTFDHIDEDLIPSLDSAPVIEREKQLDSLHMEVTSHFNSAIQEARLPEKNTAVDFFKAVQIWLVSLEEILDIYEQTYRETLDLVREAIQGKISPLLLDIKTLESASNHVNMRYENAHFPVISHIEALKLLSAYVTRTGLKISIDITFPLYSIDYYHLYRMYPILIPQGNNISSFIEPPNEYFLLANHQYNHTFWDHRTLRECITLSKQHYCLAPTNLRTSSCELQLLMDSSNTQYDGCTIKTQRHEKTEWTYLQESDEWIYSAPSLANLTIQCHNDFKIQDIIHGLGILRLARSCTASDQHTVLKPRNNRMHPGYLYESTVSHNLTVNEISPSPSSHSNKENDSRTISMERLVLVLYFIWPISIIICVAATAILTHYIYKTQTSSFEGSVKYTRVLNIGEPLIAKTTQTTITEQVTKNVSTSTEDIQINVGVPPLPPPPPAKTHNQREPVYENPPSPKPITFPPPTFF